MTFENCVCCKKQKPLVTFNYGNKKCDNCSDKNRKAAEKYRANNKEAIARSNKKTLQKMREERPQFTMFYSAKRRAKVGGYPFDITINDIVIPEFCPALGIKLETAKGHCNSPFSPTLDKIIPELGYVKGNIQVISRRANTMKNDASPDELIRFASWIKGETSAI